MLKWEYVFSEFSVYGLFSPTYGLLFFKMYLFEKLGRKMGILFRLQDYFSPSVIIRLYKDVIQRYMEECSQTCGVSSFSRHLERSSLSHSEAERLINCCSLLINYPDTFFCKEALALYFVSIGNTTADVWKSWQSLFTSMTKHSHFK